MSIKKDPKWDIRNFLCFALYSTSRSMTRLYQKHLTALDLTYPQLLVLVLLRDSDGREKSVNELCRELHLDSGTVTPLLKRLESKKLITRKRSRADERSVLVKLTSSGRQTNASLKDLGIKMLCDLKMSPDEVVSLAHHLHKIRTQIDSSLGPITSPSRLCLRPKPRVDHQYARDEAGNK